MPITASEWLDGETAQLAAAAEELSLRQQVRWALDFRVPAGRYSLARTHRMSVYAYLPFLLREAFPRAETETLGRLSLAVRLHLSHLQVLHRSPDGRRPELEVGLSATLWCQQAMRELAAVMGAHRGFWDRFDLYLAEYARAVVLERDTCWVKPHPYRRAWEEELGRGKPALFKYVAAALAYASEREGALEPLEASLDRFSIALQMWDDLADWEADYSRGYYSPFLARTLEQMAGESPAGLPSGEEVALRIESVGTAREARKDIQEHCAAAMEAIPDLPLAAWRGFIDRFRDLVAAGAPFSLLK